MGKWLRPVLLVIACALLIPCVFAADVLDEEAQILQTDTLYDGLDQQTRDLLGDVSPTKQVSFADTLYKIVYSALSGSTGSVREAVSSAAMLLAAVFLCAMAENAESELTSRSACLAGTLAIFLICMRSFGGLIEDSIRTVQKISEYSKLLLPVLSSATIASGGVGAGSALYAGSMLFMSILCSLLQGVLSPMVYIYCALSAAECSMAASSLTKLRELTGSVISVCLKAVMYAFTGYLTLTGILSGAADDLRLKTAKAALSGTLPVVGSIVADASGSVIAGAGILKNTVGVFGMLAVLAVGIFPFVRIGISYLALKLTAAVSAVFSGGTQAKMLSCMATGMGYVLAMTGCTILMVLVSVCCFLKAVGG